MAFQAVRTTGDADIASYLTITFPTENTGRFRKELNDAVEKFLKIGVTNTEGQEQVTNLMNIVLSAIKLIDLHEQKLHDLNFRMTEVKSMSEAQNVVEKDKPSWRKRITESKSAHALSVFSGNDKEKFKEWNEKLINQFSVIYNNSRQFFKKLMKRLNTERKVLSEDTISMEINSRDDEEGNLIDEQDLEYMIEDLYFILMEKTTGECHEKSGFK